MVAISPDTPKESSELAARIGTSISLFSDEELSLMRKFGIAFKSGKRALPVPAVFVIDGKGTIIFHYVHPDYKVRLDIDLLLAAAQVNNKEK